MLIIELLANVTLVVGILQKCKSKNTHCKKNLICIVESLCSNRTIFIGNECNFILLTIWTSVAVNRNYLHILFIRYVLFIWSLYIHLNSPWVAMPDSLPICFNWPASWAFCWNHLKKEKNTHSLVFIIKYIEILQLTYDSVRCFIRVIEVFCVHYLVITKCFGTSIGSSRMCWKNSGCCNSNDGKESNGLQNINNFMCYICVIHHFWWICGNENKMHQTSLLIYFFSAIALKRNETFSINLSVMWNEFGFSFLMDEKISHTHFLHIYLRICSFWYNFFSDCLMCFHWSQNVFWCQKLFYSQYLYSKF